MIGPADDDPRTPESVEAELDRATAGELYQMMRCAQLEGQVERLKALLREVEWGQCVRDDEAQCGFCGRSVYLKEEGHAPDCRLKAAIV